VSCDQGVQGDDVFRLHRAGDELVPNPRQGKPAHYSVERIHTVSFFSGVSMRFGLAGADRSKVSQGGGLVFRFRRHDSIVTGLSLAGHPVARWRGGSVEKLAYAMANPVKAGLVAHARDWPGLTVLPHELGRRTLVIARPPVFFRADNSKWPDTVELTLTLPPALAEDHRAEEVRDAVNEELERQEREARAEVKARGWRVLGTARVRRLSPYRRATSFELLRGQNPTFAVGRGQRKVFFRAVAELRAFRSAYRQALEQWRARLRSVVFPQGTWCMCHVHGVVVQT
jgi:hypothetical protein